MPIEVAGRDLAWPKGRLVPIAVCGRPYPARAPGPTLLEKLPFDVFRDETELLREETEDVKDGFR